MLKNYIQDENTSADTKRWLNDFTSNKRSQSLMKNKSTDPSVIVQSLYNLSLSDDVFRDLGWNGKGR